MADTASSKRFNIGFQFLKGPSATPITQTNGQSVPEDYEWNDRAIITTVTSANGEHLGSTAVSWRQTSSPGREAIFNPGSVVYHDDEAAQDAKWRKTKKWAEATTAGYLPATLDLIHCHSIVGAAENKTQMDTFNAVLKAEVQRRLELEDQPHLLALFDGTLAAPSDLTSAKDLTVDLAQLQKLQWDCSVQTLTYLLTRAPDKDFSAWWTSSGLPEVQPMSRKYRKSAHGEIDREGKHHRALLDALDSQPGDIRPALNALSMVMSADSGVTIQPFTSFTGSAYESTNE